jgi:alcohol dehydrogenase
MKAAQYSEYGGPEIIQVTENAPKPSIGEGQVVVEVHAASLNPYDTYVRQGNMNDKIPLTFPVTIGGDIAGVITEVGEGVTDFKPGDEIYGQSIIPSGSGSVAEYASTDQNRIAKKPLKVDFVQAASLVLVGVAAVQALEDHIKLQSGQKLLIHGGAGGIGSIAVQLAKHLGAHVTSTASTDDLDFVKSLGADEVIDYKTQKFEEIVKDVDAVFDTAGGETAQKSLTVLRKGGILVSMSGSGSVNEDQAREKEITAMVQATATRTNKLQRLAEHVDQGAIKPQVDKIFPLDQVHEAFEYFEKDSPKGKVVIQVK